MKQYNSIKAKYPDALLLFRVGDFYETFNDDAVRCSKVLGIVLTKRSNGAASEMELAGFPYHALDTYLPKLVHAGMRVAICDQLEDPKLTKSIVKRGVTELVTPGVAINDKILDYRSNNFLCALHHDNDKYGVAFVDASTGEFVAGEGSWETIDKLIQNFSPGEIIFQKRKQKELLDQLGKKYFTYQVDEWVFQSAYCYELLTKQFQSASLKGFGIDDMPLAIIAAGAALYYLNETQQRALGHITSIARIEESQYVWLDKFSIRNLELVNTPFERGKSLIEVIDKTLTPMGARLLRRWLLLPLKDIQAIQQRQDAVSYFVNSFEHASLIAAQLKQVGDLERLISKAALRKISPREMVQLKRSLEATIPLKQFCLQADNTALKQLAQNMPACDDVIKSITVTINDDPPALITKGGAIRAGVDAALDDLRHISTSGKEYLLEIQRRESAATGITSLKVAFNNVFGYYIEVTNAHKDKVPGTWLRKQTLTNAERYITPELKEYEEKILGAEEKILALEEKIFNQLVDQVIVYVQSIQTVAAQVARIDCLYGFATAAINHHYIRPVVDDTHTLDIRDGRHPVLEQQMPLGEPYVANDIYLDNAQQQLIMITGPNMAGKSALLRQTALIVLLAQTGSFVPARSAGIGVIDKIFTRVGASDNISAGESTFMVEMNETASILNNLSNRSLVLLDEIGRGTATYDGISIAWAIAEFIHEHPTAKAKTLFATHYHELNEMTNTFARIKNFNVSIKESGNKILFLRKLVPGGIEHSFGIHVAKLAGMPVKVLQRADQLLMQLEKAHSSNQLVKQITTKEKQEALQLSFFQLDDPVLEQIREEIVKTDINTLTPVEALLKLQEIKKLLGR